MQFVGQPDEGDVQAWVAALQQDVAVLAPRLANLPLRAVAIYGVLKMALGDGDHHLRGTFGHSSINHTERKSREGSVSAREERLYSLAAAQAFGFGKGVNCVHLVILFFLVGFRDVGIQGVSIGVAYHDATGCIPFLTRDMDAEEYASRMPVVAYDKADGVQAFPCPDSSVE